MYNRAYKYRIYPSKTQKVLLAKTFGCVRFYWNYCVDNFNHYCSHGPNIPKKTTTELRQEFPWMREVSAASIQQKDRDFVEFKQQFFSKSRKSAISKPSFKKKSTRQSYRLPNQKFKLHESTIQLEKLGKVRCIFDRRPRIDCRFINVTISQEPDGKYYVSVLVEEDIKPTYNTTGSIVGVDVGLTAFATLSTGEKIENPKWFRKSQTKLQRLQRKLSRTIQKSNRNNRVRLKYAKMHKKITNQRTWFHHQFVNKLLREHDIICIEDLNITGMVKNHNLAKSIHDAGWASMFAILRYKSEWNNKTVSTIHRFFPSTRLCECGTKHVGLKLHDRIWTCLSCGTIHDRDVLASRNIETEGLRIIGMSSYRSQATEEQTMIGCETLTSVGLFE